jgi:hypothetical protein
MDRGEPDHVYVCRRISNRASHCYGVGYRNVIRRSRNHGLGLQQGRLSILWKMVLPILVVTTSLFSSGEDREDPAGRRLHIFRPDTGPARTNSFFSSSHICPSGLQPAANTFSSSPQQDGRARTQLSICREYRAGWCNRGTDRHEYTGGYKTGRGSLGSMHRRN